MKFTAAGDALIQQRILKEYDGFKEIKDYICKGDVRFFNLETTLNEQGECFASQFSGGTYLRANPKVLGDVAKYGFNMVNFNNNHSLDFSYDGFLKTLDYIGESGLVQSGSGRSLDEAAAPGYLETENGRVALISVNTTFDPSMMAGNPTDIIPGRPGLNGLRLEKIQIVTAADFEVVKNIGAETGINDEILSDMADGYINPWPEDVYYLDNVCFTVGETAGQHIKLNKADIARVEKAICKAKENADYVLISLHTHEMQGSNSQNIPEFISEFCHWCIDKGAHSVIGHGPHRLRGIEVYKECPIFYSLGDFILQLYSVEIAPEDFYQKYGLTSSDGIYNLLKTRSKNFTIGLMEREVMQEAIIPYWEMENGKLKKLELLPITCYKNDDASITGLPVVGSEEKIMERLEELSQPFGVKMELKNGVINCSW